MKKLLFSVLCLALSSTATNATILYTASCGEQTYTVDETYFDSKEDAEEYYKLLDKILCEQKEQNKQEITDVVFYSSFLSLDIVGN